METAGQSRRLIVEQLWNRKVSKVNESLVECFVRRHGLNGLSTLNYIVITLILFCVTFVALL